MREFKYGRRRRQYDTFAELYDSAKELYRHRYMCFGYAFLRLLPRCLPGYHINKYLAQNVGQVLANKYRYRPADRTTSMNVFGLQLFFYSNWLNLDNSRREFDNDCTHDDLNAAIADNQLNIRSLLQIFNYVPTQPTKKI